MSVHPWRSLCFLELPKPHADVELRYASVKLCCNNTTNRPSNNPSSRSAAITLSPPYHWLIRNPVFIHPRPQIFLSPPPAMGEFKLSASLKGHDDDVRVHPTFTEHVTP